MKMYLKDKPKPKKKAKPKMRLKGKNSGTEDHDFYGETDKHGFKNIKFYQEYK
jgi:hypothetical protein